MSYSYMDKVLAQKGVEILSITLKIGTKEDEHNDLFPWSYFCSAMKRQNIGPVIMIEPSTKQSSCESTIPLETTSVEPSTTKPTIKTTSIPETFFWKL